MKEETTMNYMQAFRDISTCDLSDACDALGVVPATSGQVKAAYPNCPSICGPIVTCKMSPTGKEEIVIGTIKPLLTADPGSIFLIDAGGNLQHNTIGSLVTVVAVQQRIAGAVVDGCVRDIQGTAALNFPTYSRGTVIQSVRTRVGIESTNEPVMFGGTRVEPGWIAAADANGVIVFPASHAVALFRAAYRAAAVERKIVQQMTNGADFIAVHKALKYDATMSEQLTDDKIVG
jgi:4-hydroxy-4-methyl-2-oxoglutarate aldolase